MKRLMKKASPLYGPYEESQYSEKQLGFLGIAVKNKFTYDTIPELFNPENSAGLISNALQLLGNKTPLDVVRFFLRTPPELRKDVNTIVTMDNKPLSNDDLIRVHGSLKSIGLTLDNFNTSQIYQINKGVKNGLGSSEIQVFANPEINHLQMKYIRQGLEKGYDVSIYSDYNKFNYKQMQELYYAFDRGLTDEQVMEIASPKQYPNMENRMKPDGTVDEEPRYRNNWEMYLQRSWQENQNNFNRNKGEE